MNNKGKYFDREFLSELDSKINDISNASIGLWSRNYLYGHLDHYSSILGEIHPLLENNSKYRILDVGGVPSHIDAYLKKLGNSVEVLDLNPDRIKEFLDAYNIPSHRINVETEDFPFKNETFDLVLFNEVLEHLRFDPLSPFKEIYRVLKPDGKLLLSTPNITPKMRWEFLKGVDYIDDLVDEFEKINKLGHMGHFRIYSLRELDRILRHNNFEIVRTNYGGKVQEGISTFWKVLFREKMRKQVYIISSKRKV